MDPFRLGVNIAVRMTIDQVYAIKAMLPTWQLGAPVKVPYFDSRLAASCHVSNSSVRYTGSCQQPA